MHGAKLGRSQQYRQFSSTSTITSKEPDALLKLVLIGASNSGKTSILLRFVEQRFQDGLASTIGVDFKINSLLIDDKVVKVQVWDTAGQEKFRSVTQAYYRNAHGCIAVYDITNANSFDAISEQVTSFINYSPKATAHNIVLVGNKVDLADEKREVPFKDAVLLAKRLGLAGVVETSAKTGLETSDDAFFLTAARGLDSLEQEKLLNSEMWTNARNAAYG